MESSEAQFRYLNSLQPSSDRINRVGRGAHVQMDAHSLNFRTSSQKASETIREICVVVKLANDWVYDSLEIVWR